MAPKPEKGTPKDLSKKMKSKGLKKLKWFCQMCQKQCGDQNGFKRHCESESHQRQLLLFAENQNAYLCEFSKEFESSFMQIFKNSFGGKRTRANVVYGEYIRDRNHVHMNATIWHTLGGFVRYLGESGKCRIDENEKGWHIQYIDKEEEVRKQKLVDRVKQEKTDEDRMAEMLQRQIERDQAKTDETPLPKETEPKEFVRLDPDQKIQFKLPSMRLKQEPKIESSFPALSAPASSSSREVDIKPVKTELDQQIAIDVKANIKHPIIRKRTALEELREDEERFKERKNRRDYWLHRGIVVKVISKRASDKFYKAKGKVTRLIGKYTAEVALPSGHVAKFDQGALETVIPTPGHKMLIVNGAYRGEIAVLEKIVEDKYMLKLRISEGTRNGRLVDIAYEDASKLS